MKKTTILVIGLLTTLMLFVVACDGNGDTGAPAVTSAPAAITAPIATNTPVATSGPTPNPSAFAKPTPFAMQGLQAILDVSVEGDTLEFTRGIINLRGGSPVTLTFDNVSTVFQHSWVLVKDGTKDDVAMRGSNHPNTDWVQPDDPDVIVHTKLLDPGISGTINFPSPLQGRYQFVCTFPGHNVTMFGTFRVTS